MYEKDEGNGRLMQKLPRWLGPIEHESVLPPEETFWCEHCIKEPHYKSSPLRSDAKNNTHRRARIHGDGPRGWKEEMRGKTGYSKVAQ